MTTRHRLTRLFLVATLVLALPGVASAALLWDFYPQDLNGWTVENGFTNFRSNDGGGVTPAATSGGGFVMDSAHPTMLLQSPLVWFDGATLDGTNVMTWGSAGGAGNQGGSTVPAFADPAAVLAYNGGNSNSNGLKALAFLNTTTGVYDATLFNSGNGGTDNYNLTAAALTTAGVDMNQGYRLHYYENDQGSWGWGQLNYVNLAAGNLPPSAGTRAWDGVANGNWDDPRWAPPGAPDATLVADIGPNPSNNTVTVNGNFAAHTVNLTNNGQLIIGAGNTLEITADINAPSNTVAMMAGSALRSVYGGGAIGTLTTAGDATIDVATDLSVSGSTYNDGGVAATLTKQGPGTLALDNTSGTGVIAAATTFRVEAGTLSATGADGLGGADVVLTAGALRLDGGAVTGLNGSLFRNIPRDETYVNLDGSTYTDTPGRIFTGDKADTILSIASETGYDIVVNGPTYCGNNNDWGPFPTLDSDWEEFVTAYSGVFIPDTSGVHNFRWDNDDRGLMYLDYDGDGVFQNSDRIAAYAWGANGNVSLTAGTPYNILYMMQEYGGGRDVEWWMTPPGGTEAYVDTTTSPGAWQVDLGAPIDMQSTVTVDAPGGAALELVTGLPANLRELVLTDGALRITGGSQLTVEQASISPATSGAVGLQTDTTVILGTTTGLNGNGQTATFTKTGAADLILNQEGVGLDNVIFDVQEGRLIGVHGSNPFLAAAMEINGGELVLGTAGGNVEYNNQINATAGTLTAGAAGGGVGGPATITVGDATNGVTVAPGGLLRVQAMDGLALDILGQTIGGDFEFKKGEVKLSGGGTVEGLKIAVGAVVGTGDSKVNVTNQLDLNTLTYSATSGSFAVSGDSLLDARTLELSGGTTTAAPAGVERFTAADGALHNWCLDESTGATLAADSIAGKDGNVNGNRTFGPGQISNALLADGSGDYVTVPAAGAPVDLPGNSFSISFWAKRDDTGERFIIGQGDDGGSRTSLHIGFRDADTFTLAFWGDDLNYDNASVIGDTDNYHHWVCTYDADGNRQEIWLDGAYVSGRGTGADFAGSGSNDFWIGRRRDGKDYNGDIDDVWVFDHVLDAGDIASLVLAGSEGWRDAGGGIVDPGTDLLVTGDGAFHADTATSAQFGDITLVDDSVLTLTGAPDGITVDDVTGNGTLAILSPTELLVGGTFHPGESPGMIIIDGDLAFLPGSIFHVDVEGLIPGDEYSQAVLLGGVLDISNAALHVQTTFTSGILPGDTLMLINNQGGTVVGNFLPGATVSDGNGVYLWDVVYQGDDVFLQNTYIPEPATLTLLGLGLLAARRRRRKR